ncbi:PREDICTED: LOW QUALITY PROTEIN: probable G-protein coupled receptor 97 [Pterocles gutturalis]|uniref:LOW QUALITY PROTEIN: probable G-protein coupled receptor 97 n=1 Tax=Pterocles gutturalis TaxID=240206 RepID=UPI000528603B|nr:PREDICTED: LOW QUALITY PROTEIN: probable G-protein coupled receptor 97 [Pterocles gutturalis]
MVALEERGDGTPSPNLPQRCLEVGRSGSPACGIAGAGVAVAGFGGSTPPCPPAGPALCRRLAGLKVLLLNVSRAVTRDVLIGFSPTEGYRILNMTERGKTGKIQLPRETLQSLSSKTAHMVVTVLNSQQSGMFEDINQTVQILDGTMVGITVGETSISGLQNPVQLTLAHGQLPQDITPQCVFWDPSKGMWQGWSSSGCVTQPRDKGTVCSRDHLTFCTLLLVTSPLPAAPACPLPAPPRWPLGCHP